MITPVNISIVTVVLNNLHGLIKSRESLQEQSFTGWEHIIIDGLSTDGTESFGNELCTDFRTKFLSEKDSGIYDAMNKGWKLCQLDSFIIFLNAGDVFVSPTALEELLLKLQSSHRGILWTCTTHEEIGPDKSSWVCKLVSLPTIENQLYAYGYRSHQGVFMKRELISSLGGFDVNYKVAADWDLIVKAMRVSAPLLWNEPVIRFETGGFSSEMILKAHLELRKLRKKYIWNSPSDRFFDDLYCAIFYREIGYSNYLTSCLALIQRLNLLSKKRTFANRAISLPFSTTKKVFVRIPLVKIVVRPLFNLSHHVKSLVFDVFLNHLINALRNRLKIKPLDRP